MANRPRGTTPLGVTIEYEREEGKKSIYWWIARMLTDNGTIRFESATPKKMLNFTFEPARVTRFSIEMIADPALLSSIYGGGVIALAVAAIAGRWVKFPIIRLEQPDGEQGQQWIHVRGSGVPQRRQTRKIAERIAETLAENGYSGMVPDLNDDSLWRVPTAQIVIGLALVGLMFACVGVVFWAVLQFAR